MVCPWDMFPSICVSTMPTSSGYDDVLTLPPVSISAAIIVPSIIIALNLQNAEDYLSKHGRVRSLGPAPDGAGSGVGETPLEGLEADGLEADGRRKQKLPDEELGRKSANSFF